MAGASTQQFDTAPTPFLDQLQEITEIGILLADPSCRLLTLVGPGGIGKTWLAMETASRCCAFFPDGVFWVPLAQLSVVEISFQLLLNQEPYSGEAGAPDLTGQFVHRRGSAWPDGRLPGSGT